LVGDWGGSVTRQFNAVKFNGTASWGQSTNNSNDIVTNNGWIDYNSWSTINVGGVAIDY